MSALKKMKLLNIRWKFFEFALEGAAVDVQAFCGSGNIAAAVGENTVDMLPLGAGQ